MLARGRIGWLPGVIQRIIDVPDPPTPVVHITGVVTGRAARRVHMPLGSFSSYIPTMQAFEGHWSGVNTALGGSAATDFKLADSFALADLTALRTGLQTAIDHAISTENIQETASGSRDISKTNMSAKVIQFRAAVKATFPKGAQVNSLMRTPKRSANQAVFMRALIDMRTLWTQINALSATSTYTPPLLLGTYTLAAFTTDAANMQNLFLQVVENDALARSARKDRDSLLANIRARLIQYRNASIARFGPASPQVAALPALSSPPGSTPAAVSVSGVWNPVTVHADLTWTPSTNANLSHYSVRTAPGLVYKRNVESVVQEIDKTLHSYSTNVGLAAPGAVALFKVYVVLTTGNAKGSVTVSVTRS